MVRIPPDQAGTREEPAMDREEVLGKVRAYVVENFYYGKAGAVQDETNLMEDGAVDSTGFMELVTFVEETFPIAVDDEDLVPENFAAIDRISAYVLGKMS
jgi:acyl carrier protein